MENRLLYCKVHKGMFAAERVVELTPANGALIAFFVPADAVEGVDPDGNGRLRVRVFNRDNRDWAVLPTEYSDAIPVSRGDLVTR